MRIKYCFELRHRLGGIGQIFVVDGESAEVLEPGERAHDNPLFLKRLKFCRHSSGQSTNSTTHPHFSITQSPSEPRYPPSARFFFRRGNLCLCFWIAFGAPFDFLVPTCPFAGRVGVMRGPDAAGIDYPQAVALLTARGLTGNGVQGFYYILDHTLEDNVSSSFLARLCFFL